MDESMDGYITKIMVALTALRMAKGAGWADCGCNFRTITRRTLMRKTVSGKGVKTYICHLLPITGNHYWLKETLFLVLMTNLQKLDTKDMHTGTENIQSKKLSFIQQLFLFNRRAEEEKKKQDMRFSFRFALMNINYLLFIVLGMKVSCHSVCCHKNQRR